MANEKHVTEPCRSTTMVFNQHIANLNIVKEALRTIYRGDVTYAVDGDMPDVISPAFRVYVMEGDKGIVASILVSLDKDTHYIFSSLDSKPFRVNEEILKDLEQKLGGRCVYVSSEDLVVEIQAPNDYVRHIELQRHKHDIILLVIVYVIDGKAWTSQRLITFNPADLKQPNQSLVKIAEQLGAYMDNNLNIDNPYFDYDYAASVIDTTYNGTNLYN